MTPDTQELVHVIGQLAFVIACIGAGIIFSIISLAYTVKTALILHGINRR